MRMLRIASLGLILAFFSVWAVIGFVYGVDLPFLDQWDRPLAQIARLFSTGRVGLVDLWLQQNEARKVFPTAISVGLAAALGRYEPKVELLVGGVLMVAVVVAIVRLARAGGMSMDAALGLALLFTALAGARRTAGFHLYSITFERLLPELAIVASLTLLVVGRPDWPAACASIALLVVGQYSYPGAIVGWLLVPGFALLAFRDSLRPVAWPLLSVAACGALSSLGYFWSYGHPSHHPPLLRAFAEPWTSWRSFFLRFLGNPISGTPRAASIAALLALLACVVAGWLAVRRTTGLERRLALAWLALAGYSISQAGLATLGRVSMDIGHALRSDYIVHAVYLYVALAALMLLAFPRPAEPVLLVIVIAVSALLFAPLLSRDVRQELRAVRASKLEARACALAERPDASLCSPDNPWLRPSPEIVRDRAAQARAAGAWGSP